MKQKKWFYLFILSAVILSIASMPFLNFSSSESAIEIGSILNNWIKDKHIVRLYKLTLTWDGDNSVTLTINPSTEQLKVENGIVAWNDGNSSQWYLSSIWWWEWNSIDDNSDNSWIAWWKNNKITDGPNSVIWGWSGNTIVWRNAVIAWGQWNVGGNYWVVAWWRNNTASGYGVVLWGLNNNAEESSLVMWSGASWRNAFSRNAKAQADSARIDAKNGILIGTTESIQWVNLVVSGAVKITWNDGDEWQPWEIKVVDGCFYAYDWNYWHLISQTNNSSDCQWFVLTESCQFGNVYLQQWDQVTWYKATLDQNCTQHKVVCSGGVLVEKGTNATGYDKPYCHKK